MGRCEQAAGMGYSAELPRCRAEQQPEHEAAGARKEQKGIYYNIGVRCAQKAD
jgi:hypothetical protein